MATTTTPDRTAEQKRQALIELLDKVIGNMDENRALMVRLQEVIASGSDSADALWVDYIRWVEQASGEKFVGNVRQGKSTLRRLRKSFAADDLRLRLARFISDADPFVRNQGYPLTLFAKQVHQLGTVPTGGRSRTVEDLATEIKRDLL